MRKIYVIILMVIILVGTSAFYSNVKASVTTLEDGTELKKGIEVQTTRSKNIYERKRENKGDVEIYSYQDTGKNIPANTNLKIKAIDEVNSFGNSYTAIEVRYYDTSGTAGNVAKEGWIKITDEDMEEGGKGSGLKKVSRTEEDEKANEEFKKKYTKEKIEKMNKDELAKMEEEASKLKSPDEEIIELLQAADSRRLEIGEVTTGDTVYRNPIMTSDNDNAEKNLDDVVTDADNFVNKGEIKYLEDQLQNFSKTMYNILLAIGIAVAVIVGGIIGIKLMSSGVEDKAEVKKLLVPYVVGCIVVFGAFGIWNLVVTILSNV